MLARPNDWFCAGVLTIRYSLAFSATLLQEPFFVIRDPDAWSDRSERALLNTLDYSIISRRARVSSNLPLLSQSMMNPPSLLLCIAYSKFAPYDTRTRAFHP